MEWLSEFLRDRKKIRNVISGIIIGIPFLILLFYWGVLDNFELTRDLDFKTLGFISLVFVLSGDQVKIDWRRRSKEDFEDTDIEHKATIKECDSLIFTDEDYKLGKAYEDKLNKETQHKYNVKFTDTQIAKLDRKINKLIRKNSKVEEVEKLRQLKKHLKENPIQPDWWNFKYRFTPFDYNDIASSYEDMGEINTIEDGASIKVNAINRNRFWSFLFGIGRSVVQASAGLYILFTAPLGQSLVIILMLAITLAVIALMAYSMNTLYMMKKVKPATIKKLYRKQEMKKYIDSNETHEVTLTESLINEVITNTNEEQNALERKLDND